MTEKLDGIRLTLPTHLVLRALLEDPTREMYGLEVCRAAGLPSGTIYPLLGRLEGAGIVSSRWEDTDPGVERRPGPRPRRRYYRLTPDGAVRVREVLAAVPQQTTAVARLRPGLFGGTT